jgi:hypothetical protein
VRKYVDALVELVDEFDGYGVAVTDEDEQRHLAETIAWQTLVRIAKLHPDYEEGR